MLARHTNILLHMDTQYVKSDDRPYFESSPLSQQISAQTWDGKPQMYNSPVTLHSKL